MRPNCAEHVFELVAVDLDETGAWSWYQCVRCPGLVLVEPGGVHPQTV